MYINSKAIIKKYLYLFSLIFIVGISQGSCSDLNDSGTGGTSSQPLQIYHASSDELYNEGVVSHINGQSEKAVALWIQSGLPLGLFNAAKFYQDGIVGKINGKPDTEKAAQLYRQANTPDALCNLAFLYQYGHAGLKDDGTRDYEKAASLYKLSGVPIAKHNLACMYHHGLIGVQDGKADFKTAAQLYLESGLPDAICNRGNLYRDGRVGLINGKPNYQEAERLYTLSNNPTALWNRGRLYRDGHRGARNGVHNYKVAAKCFEDSRLPEALCDLGCLYARGQIGLKDGKPDLEKAQALFLASKVPEAFINLGTLFFFGHLNSIDGKPDYQSAFRYLSKSPFLAGKLLQLEIIENHYESIACFFPTLSKEQLITSICNSLKNNRETGEPRDKELIFGLLAYFQDKNLNQALIHFNHALVLGAHSVKYQITKIQKLLKLEEENTLEAKESKQDEAISLSSIVITEPEPTQKPELMSEITTADERPKKYKPIKPVLSRAERIQKILAKVNKRFGHLLILAEAKETNEVKPIPPLTINFINGRVKEDYESLLPHKVQELLADIEEKPYGTEGSGKPEVLKGKFLGFKGCISRRLDGEERFVYKVTGPREIMILSCKGHYK